MYDEIKNVLRNGFAMLRYLRKCWENDFEFHRPVSCIAHAHTDFIWNLLAVAVVINLILPSQCFYFSLNFSFGILVFLYATTLSHKFIKMLCYMQLCSRGIKRISSSLVQLSSHTIKCVHVCWHWCEYWLCSCIRRTLCVAEFLCTDCVLCVKHGATITSAATMPTTTTTTTKEILLIIKLFEVTVMS